MVSQDSAKAEDIFVASKYRFTPHEDSTVAMKYFIGSFL